MILVNGTGHSDSHANRSRRRLGNWVGVGSLWILGVVFVSASWVGNLPVDAVRILVLFGCGVLSGLGAGVFLGREVRHSLNTERGIRAILSLALLTLVVFMLPAEPSSASRAYEGEIALNAFSIGWVACLLAADVYLLGFFLFPGPFEVRGPKRFLLGVPLYGSLVAGIYLGSRADLWQRGTVPFGKYTMRKGATGVSLKDAVESLEDSFPPDATVELNGREIILPSVPYRGVPLRSRPLEVTAQGRTIEVQLPLFSRVVEVIEATGPVVTAQGRRFEFHGYEVSPPYRDQVERHGMTPTIWNLSGEPVGELPTLDHPQPAGSSSAAGWDSCYPWCTVVVSFPEKADPRELRLIQYPGGYECKTIQKAKSSVLTEQTFLVPLPICETVELRVEARAPDRKEYLIPAQEGSTLVLDTNRLFLARIYPWALERIVHAEGAVKRRTSAPDERTTAVFLCGLGEWLGELEVDAVLDDGGIAEGRAIRRGFWLVSEFQVTRDRIRSFRVREPRGIVEIRWRIPKLQGMPPGNENCTNVLDLRFPYLDFSAVGAANVDRFLQEILQNGFQSEGWPEEVSPVPHEKVTLRDILNYYYPGRWWVSDGRVYTTQCRFGPIVWKVSEAIRELRNRS
jgi:hypothetical protein